MSTATTTFQQSKIAWLFLQNRQVKMEDMLFNLRNSAGKGLNWPCQRDIEIYVLTGQVHFAQLKVVGSNMYDMNNLLLFTINDPKTF